MLGKRQKSELETCAKWAKSDTVVLHVVIGSWDRGSGWITPNIHVRGNSGFPISVVMYYTDVEPPESDLSAYISNCKERYSAFDKAKEIARYLVDTLAVPKEKVSIKSKIGKE